MSEFDSTAAHPPHADRSSTALRRILLWTVWPALGAGLCWTVGYLNPPRDPPRLVPNVRWLTPASQAYQAVCVFDNDAPAMPRQVQVVLHERASDDFSFFMMDMRVQLPTLEYQADGNAQGSDVVTPQMPARGTFDRQAATAWLQSGGLDTSSEPVQGEIAELVSVLEALAAGADLAGATQHLESFKSSAVATKGGSRSAFQQFVAMAPGIWSVVWLIGVLVILRWPAAQMLPAGSARSVHNEQPPSSEIIE